MTYKEKVLEHYKGDTPLVESCLDNLKDLLAMYKEDVIGTVGCPLCRGRCLDCPWFVLTGRECLSMRKCFEQGLQNVRRRQIRSWIKTYEEASIYTGTIFFLTSV